MKTTNKQADEILARAEKATPEPWEFRNGHSRDGDSIEVLMAEVGHAAEDEDPEYGEVLEYPGPFSESEVSANWELCKHSRTDVPALVADLKEMAGLLRAAHEVMNHLGDALNDMDVVGELDHVDEDSATMLKVRAALADWDRDNPGGQ